MSKPRTVDEYIEGFGGQARELVEQLHAPARETVLEANEAIKWGHPAWVHPSGTILFVISGHAKHANVAFTRVPGRPSTPNSPISEPARAPSSSRTGGRCRRNSSAA
ncbi:hypothetical protein [Actinacidiphila glaucinigra]|uniref:hypothetical protein n=1 Tax=Actinacidiphila glaucinigra TaxID=235986 RepID=UPI0035E2A93C